MNKKFIFSTNTLLIAMSIAVVFLGGFVFGLRVGYIDGSQRTTEIRNQMLDIAPYDASLSIKDLEYSNISPAGFTIKFDTDKTTGTVIYFSDINGLVCEWAVYPSDVFTMTDVNLVCFEERALIADIETFPEGGTVMFRIKDTKTNRGSLWFYIDLPRSNDTGTILPPPYLPRDGG
jgi:hypothetical protein